MRFGPFELSFRRRRAQVREMDNSIQYVGDLILQIEALQGTSTFNRYVTREAQVDETIRKYRGIATKGNILVRNILNTRRAFTSGRGLGVLWKGGDEKQFINKFFQVNGLNLSYLRQLGLERSFEGQVLLTLNQHADGVPRVRFVSWYDTHYEIAANPLDYGQILYARWLGAEREVSLDPGRIAFMKFDTRLNSYTGTPLMAGILGLVEELDDALVMLRKVNIAAANPTPYFQFQQEDDADAFRDYLTSSNWKMGMALAGSGTATMLQIGYGPYTALVEQITTSAQIIAGHTAVPPHYLGFAREVANRSVADDMSNAFVAISETETSEWGNGFTELAGRAMAMYNAQTGSTLSYDGKIAIEVISREEFGRVASVWLPMWLAGGISTPTFLSKVPGVDELTEADAVNRELKERQAQTPGQVIPDERKVGLDALKTYGVTGGGV